MYKGFLACCILFSHTKWAEVMRNVTVKYIGKNKPTGSFAYRRWVQKVLESLVCQNEFLKVLGKAQSEAVMHYGREHEPIEP